MTKTFAFSLAALITAGSSVALAHGPGDGECHGGPGRGPGAHFEELDTNKDGSVTQAEFLAHGEARFAQADTNKDGKLTKEERQAAHQAHMKERFAKHDTNKDGKLTKDELGKMPEEFQKRVDSNGDGAITQAEMEAAKGKMHEKHGRGPGDPMGDKTVTREDMKAKAVEHFTRMDANKDGKVTKDELKQGHGKGHGRGHDQDRDRDQDEQNDEG
jgi:Ca2+-binding EF-hand superfamily protein